ncbi:alpha/beta fold hydrolase [Paenibacillus arenilitoris]|uniref:Alpha/beta hydrolase n=1 Tax=Paenibacillus arenilitoris TaxID=2772299 RepID=A0A927CT45_9BACL|nr:alpha/beta hydrolase [Paenibacillus arenilitoris]MBD2871391.1 alpha/beta hydrolase [Paenibacillus arenilitoris]
MNYVYSQDGTAIAYEKIGSGPPLILVDGALCSRENGPNGALAAQLQRHYTVYTYDRRGRAGSGNTMPYEIEREIEDLSALIGEAGGSAFVYGISSGAALALEAANRLPSVKKLALYEAPFVVDASRKPVPADYSERMEGLLAAGRRGAAVKHFMRTGVGLPAPVVAMMPLMPAWSKLKAVAHTLPYDTLLTVDHQRGKPLEAGRWSSVTVPTLVAAGGKSPAWMRVAMEQLARALPNAEHRTLEGQTHIVKPEALAPVLRDFFAN